MPLSPRVLTSYCLVYIRRFHAGRGLVGLRIYNTMWLIENNLDFMYIISKWEVDKMKSRAGVHAGLAATPCGIIPSTSGGYRVALIVVIVLLGFSAIVLFFNNLSSHALWARACKA